MRDPLLVGERVYLRALAADDARVMAELDAVETDTFMWRMRMPSSPMEHEKWIAEMYRQTPPSSVWLAVCTRHDDACIGVVGVVGVNWLHRTGETASFLGPPAIRNLGYGTEAKHLLLEYCFDHLGFHVLQSVVDEPNTRSAAALGKQGYRLAGRRKWTALKNGRYVDALVFDVMREDWLVARDAWRASRTAAAPVSE
jgi:RimJ/RimL family protein N-acetyltransferase